MTQQQQQLEKLQSVLRTRVNILCLGDDFGISKLIEIFPGIGELTKESVERQSINKKRLITLLPTASQSKHIGAIDIEKHPTDVFFVKSDNFNSISLTICKESLGCKEPLEHFKDIVATICKPLCIDNAIVFSAETVKKDISEFIKGIDGIQNSSGTDYFRGNGIDTSIVCLYGRNNNAATDQGEKIADIAKATADKYKTMGVKNIMCICTDNNANIFFDWAKAFSMRSNGVENKIAETEKAIETSRRIIKIAFDNNAVDEKTLKEADVYDGLFHLNEIDYVFPENYRSFLKNKDKNEIKNYLLNHLNIK